MGNSEKKKKGNEYDASSRGNVAPDNLGKIPLLCKIFQNERPLVDILLGVRTRYRFRVFQLYQVDGIYGFIISQPDSF